MRINNNKDFTAGQIRDLVVRGMQEKKGQDIVIMDLRKVKNAICDYFVICSGTSDTQIDSISTSIEEEVYKVSRQDPWHREGNLNKEWILLDYVDVVVHVFKKDRREFYDLEQLWGDAEIRVVQENEMFAAP